MFMCDAFPINDVQYTTGGLAFPAVISCIGFVATAVGVGGGIAATMAGVTGAGVHVRQELFFWTCTQHAIYVPVYNA